MANVNHGNVGTIICPIKKDEKKEIQNKNIDSIFLELLYIYLHIKLQLCFY